MKNTKDTEQKPATRSKVKGADMPIVWNDKYIIIKKNALKNNQGSPENISTLWTSIFEIPYMMVNGCPQPNNATVPVEIWNSEVEKLVKAVQRLKRPLKSSSKKENEKEKVKNLKK